MCARKSMRPPFGRGVREAMYGSCRSARRCPRSGSGWPSRPAQRESQNLADIDELKWAVIGNLQTNKAKYVARFASEFHALDRIRVAEALQRRLEAEDRTLTVYVQVNTSAEDSKFGLVPDEAEAFVAQLPRFDRLHVVGLMTLAVFSADQDRVRGCFQVLRQ